MISIICFLQYGITNDIEPALDLYSLIHQDKQNTAYDEKKAVLNKEERSC